MLKRNDRLLVIFLVITFLLACAPVAVATPLAPPTFDALSLNTIIAQTAGAAATQTFVLLPTFTPSPTITRTPTELPTSTPTAFLFIVPTSTVPSSTPTLEISSKPFACRLALQTPGDNTVLVRGMPFKAHWQVVNTGTFAWDANSADFRFVSGDELHTTTDAFDFDQSVPTGGVKDFIVEMEAPDQPGTYSTMWRINVGKEKFCSMKLTIIVN
jgi:hypothetical protein